MRIAIMLALVLGACAGDEVDTGNGPVCSMALYDTCQSEHDCMSMQCTNFPSAMVQICTQGCSAAVPCPADINGVVPPCDASGYCLPTDPVDCRLLP
jgi:hypothetical protein